MVPRCGIVYTSNLCGSGLGVHLALGFGDEGEARESMYFFPARSFLWLVEKF